MTPPAECGCDVPPGQVCPRCGTPRPVGQTVWAEEHVSSVVPPRTTPPRHADTMANDLYDRVAGGSRTARMRRPRPRWRGFLIGAGLLAAAGVVYAYRLDAGLVHVVSIGLAFAGFVTMLKTLMGYRV